MRKVCETEENLRIIHDAVSCWMLNRKLKLNPAKTELLIISPARSQLTTPESLMFGGSLVQVSGWVRSLGFIFDSNIDFRKQIKQVKKKVINDLINISRLSRFVDKSSRMKLVQGLILSKIDFCSSLYYGLSNRDLKALQMLLNAAARVVEGISHLSRERVTSICIELHFLPMKA